MAVDAFMRQVEPLAVTVDQIPERAPVKVADRIVVSRLAEQVVTAGGALEHSPRITRSRRVIAAPLALALLVVRESIVQVLELVLEVGELVVREILQVHETCSRTLDGAD